LAFERFALEDRLPPEDLPDDARLDAVRLLLEAVRGRALAPFVLDEPLLLDEPRLLDEPLFCRDFEVVWAILASLFESGVWVPVCPIYESVLPTRSTSSPS
jgi:hypothetical protein